MNGPVSMDNAATIGELAAAMNHEHGNLLAALKTWVDAPASGLSAEEAMQHAAKIVEKMLKLHRAERLCVEGLLHPGTAEVPVGEVLEHALALVEPRLRSRGVRLSVERADGDATLTCNPGQVIAELFLLLTKTAGKPKDQERTLILSVDPIGAELQFTAFLDVAPEARQTLRYSRRH
jgi:hypothetical protein